MIFDRNHLNKTKEFRIKIRNSFDKVMLQKIKKKVDKRKHWNILEISDLAIDKDYEIKLIFEKKLRKS